MNEQLKNLAVLSNIEFTYDPTETPIRAFAECWEDDLEKFADLILFECIKLAVFKGDVETAKAIKEHFGVGE
jgi:hypothetical protein